MQQTSRGCTLPRRLGLLAGIFEDGSLSIFAIPYPKDVARQNELASESDEPTYSMLLLNWIERPSFILISPGDSSSVEAGIESHIVFIFGLGK